ncbi:hypothetical protein [Mycolicibacterium mengxianglii]|uniref:hypothetical protein n=1 Tax=Mycolicibacterium mengxianglii TaxID=2736649 RepID=UPI0018EEFA44|nr:hypothetical protein [Mycolicibacterium mengxianglii]
MERLPYIDEHAIPVDADLASTWSAILRVLCRNPADPTTVPFGFVLDDAAPPHEFALRGRHRFAAYRLTFVLSDVSHDAAHPRTRVVAETRATFPGVKGRFYRAMVIGSGGHRMVVRRMLKHIAAQSHPLTIATA